MEAHTNLEMLLVLSFVGVVTCMAILSAVIAAVMGMDTLAAWSEWQDDRKQFWQNLCIASSFMTCALISVAAVWYAAHKLGALSWIIN